MSGGTEGLFTLQQASNLINEAVNGYLTPVGGSRRYASQPSDSEDRYNNIKLTPWAVNMAAEGEASDRLKEIALQDDAGRDAVTRLLLTQILVNPPSVEHSSPLQREFKIFAIHETLSREALIPADTTGEERLGEFGNLIKSALQATYGTLAEVAEATNLTENMIRYVASKGMLPPNGSRNLTFNVFDIATLCTISYCIHTGHNLARIDAYLDPSRLNDMYPMRRVADLPANK